MKNITSLLLISLISFQTYAQSNWSLGLNWATGIEEFNYANSIGPNQFRVAGDNYTFNEVFYSSWMHQMPSLNIYYDLNEDSKLGIGFGYNFGGYFNESHPTNEQTNNLKIRDFRISPKFKTDLWRKNEKNDINLVIGLNFAQRTQTEDYQYEEDGGDGSNDIEYSMIKKAWFVSFQLGAEWERSLNEHLSYSVGMFYTPSYLFETNTISIENYTIGGQAQAGFENDIKVNNLSTNLEDYYIMNAFYLEIGLSYQL